MAAQEKLQVPRLIQAALRQHLIVIDELGFIPFTTQGAQLFFQFCAAVYDRVALIITTNLPFTKWTQLFQDETLTAALLESGPSKVALLRGQGPSTRPKWPGTPRFGAIAAPSLNSLASRIVSNSV